MQQQFNYFVINSLAILRSWKTANNLPPSGDNLNDSWKQSESWKLVQSAEKEMYRNMHIDAKNDNEQHEVDRVTDRKNGYNIQDKIEKLQSMPNITQQGGIFSTSKYLKESR